MLPHCRSNARYPRCKRTRRARQRALDPAKAVAPRDDPKVDSKVWPGCGPITKGLCWSSMNVAPPSSTSRRRHRALLAGSARPRLRWSKKCRARRARRHVDRVACRIVKIITAMVRIARSVNSNCRRERSSFSHHRSICTRQRPLLHRRPQRLHPCLHRACCARRHKLMRRSLPEANDPSETLTQLALPQRLCLSSRRRHRLRPPRRCIAGGCRSA